MLLAVVPVLVVKVEDKSVRSSEDDRTRPVHQCNLFGIRQYDVFVDMAARGMEWKPLHDHVQSGVSPGHTPGSAKSEYRRPAAMLVAGSCSLDSWYIEHRAKQRSGV
jgi:hypothetical protein